MPLIQTCAANLEWTVQNIVWWNKRNMSSFVKSATSALSWLYQSDVITQSKLPTTDGGVVQLTAMKLDETAVQPAYIKDVSPTHLSQLSSHALDHNSIRTTSVPVPRKKKRTASTNHRPRKMLQNNANVKSDFLGEKLAHNSLRIMTLPYAWCRSSQ